jgi:hypothetical protein
MNRATIRNARKSDLPAINQLIFQLISTLDKKEILIPNSFPGVLGVCFEVPTLTSWRRRTVRPS